MASLIAIPFLIGSVPLGLAVVGANHFLKDKRKTNKFLYWGGLTASAFGGWVVSNMLMTRYVGSEVFSAEGDSGEVYALKKALKAYKGTLEDCLDGRYGTDDAESVMDDLEDSHHVVRFLGAESKFKKPYMKGDKIDMKRGNDGRFRRRLVIPLEKNADTFTMSPDATPPFKKPQYFYRWIGGRSSGNPIYYGYPDILMGHQPFGLRTMPKLIHYVHSLYDEDYVKTLVDKLNDIGFAS